MIPGGVVLKKVVEDLITMRKNWRMYEGGIRDNIDKYLVGPRDALRWNNPLSSGISRSQY